MTSNFTHITTDEIIDSLSFFDHWEERYKYIIDLGKELPTISHEKKDDSHLIKGCQSQVWIDYHIDDGTLYLQVDSDAHIVKGLLAIVVSAYHQKTLQAILDFDIEAYFTKIDLIKHLSPTRGNGLRSMVHTIINIAKQNIKA
jgi:cysteine desulfuration protein SufE